MMQFFKANEKVIMVVLLAIIAPSFAFTGLMYNALDRSAVDQPFMQMHGETIGYQDFVSRQGHVAMVNKVYI